MKASGTDPGRGEGALEAVLQEASRILNAVAELCAEQREALTANDATRLAVLAERAETLAARFKLIESARRELDAAEAGPPHAASGPGVEEARRRLSEAAASVALAASGGADLLARHSAATAAISRVLEGALTGGYLPGRDRRATTRSLIMEERA